MVSFSSFVFLLCFIYTYVKTFFHFQQLSLISCFFLNLSVWRCKFFEKSFTSDTFSMTSSIAANISIYSENFKNWFSGDNTKILNDDTGFLGWRLKCSYPYILSKCLMVKALKGEEEICNVDMVAGFTVITYTALWAFSKQNKLVYNVGYCPRDRGKLLGLFSKLLLACLKLWHFDTCFHSEMEWNPHQQYTFLN